MDSGSWGRHMRPRASSQRGCNGRRSNHHEEVLQNAVRRSRHLGWWGRGKYGGVDLDPVRPAVRFHVTGAIKGNQGGVSTGDWCVGVCLSGSCKTDDALSWTGKGRDNRQIEGYLVMRNSEYPGQIRRPLARPFRLIITVMPRNSLEFVCAPVATPPVEHRLSSHSRLSLRVRRRLFPIKMPPSIGRLSGWSHSAGEPPAKGACGWRIRRRVKITLPSQPITSKPPCRALSPQTSNGYRSLSPRGRAGLGHWRSLSGTSQPGSGRAAAFDSEKTRDRKSPRSQIRQRRRLEKSQRFGKRRSALPFSELNRLGAELAWGDIISGAFARLRKDPTLTGKRGNDPDMGLLSKCNMG